MNEKKNLNLKEIFASAVQNHKKGNGIYLNQSQHTHNQLRLQ